MHGTLIVLHLIINCSIREFHSYSCITIIVWEVVWGEDAVPLQIPQQCRLIHFADCCLFLYGVSRIHMWLDLGKPTFWAHQSVWCNHPYLLGKRSFWCETSQQEGLIIAISNIWSHILKHRRQTLIKHMPHQNYL